MYGVSTSPQRLAFTLVELLVVIAVIGALVALLLPAVQAAREAARVVTCKSHLKQMAIGALVHHDQQGGFPSGGWDSFWTGDPERGLGPRQPGGWAYSILPFIEQQAIYDLGADEVGVALVQSIKQREATPIPIFFCPTRRSPFALIGDADDPPIERSTYLNASASVWSAVGPITEYAPIDYAANGLIRNATGHGEGWSDYAGEGGVVFPRSQVRIEDVGDGTSNTALLGERFVFSEFYSADSNPELAFGWKFFPLPSHYAGGGSCHVHFTGNDWKLTHDFSITTRQRLYPSVVFGSAHSNGMHFATCDGAVQYVSYSIDGETYFRIMHRDDGLPVELP